MIRLFFSVCIWCRTSSLLTALLTCKQTLCSAETACKQCCDWSEWLISWRQMLLWTKINTGMIWLLFFVDYGAYEWRAVDWKSVRWKEEGIEAGHSHRGDCRWGSCTPAWRLDETVGWWGSACGPETQVLPSPGAAHPAYPLGSPPPVGPKEHCWPLKENNLLHTNRDKTLRDHSGWLREVSRSA